jgi:hypothetical protein
MNEEYEQFRQQFTEAGTRFQQHLAAAFTSHAQVVSAFLATLARVEQRETDLQERVDELKRLLLERS